MERVFVSYARPDEQWAIWLAKIMKALGFEVEIDIWNWLVGDDFTEKMNRALDEADIVALVFSKSYFDRGRYSSIEGSAVLALLVESQKRPVVVVIDDTQLPPLLRSRVVLRLHGLRRDDAFDRVVKAMLPLLATSADQTVIHDFKAVEAIPFPGEFVVELPQVNDRLASVNTDIAGVAEEATQRLRNIIKSESEPLFIGQLYHDALRLGRTYLHQKPEVVFDQAIKLRAQIDEELARNRTPDQLRDLHLSMSYVFGILSYTALDLGHGNSADKFARVSLAHAERSAETYSRGWALGTLALIARFNGNVSLSVQFAEKGLELPIVGTARCRLLSNAAESYASLGDEQSMKTNLSLSLEALDHDVPLSAPTIADGIFYFPRARVHYYAASSLVQLPGVMANEEAAEQAELAIELFESSGPLVWSYNDILVAKVHLARALMNAGRLERVLDALESVLLAPMQYRTSWHLHFLARLNTEISAKRMATSRDGKQLSAAISAYLGETAHLVPRE